MTAFFYKAFSLLMALLAFVSVSPTHMGAGLYKSYFNVSYGEAQSEKMDIFVPVKAEKRDYNGVILYIHGGSWTGGTKLEWVGDAMRMARNGYIAATMEYTLQSETNGANALTMVDEVKMAVQKLKDFSDEHKLNITKLATTGFSAGAHLSALYAYSMADESPIPLVFTANRVAPMDFHSESWDDVYGEGMAVNLGARLAGTELTEEMMNDGSWEDVINSVSPVHFINENSVPSIFGYGGKDTTVPHGNAEITKKMLDESGITYKYIMYPNSTHMLFGDFKSAKEYDNALFDYFKTYFGY